MSRLNKTMRTSAPVAIASASVESVGMPRRRTNAKTGMKATLVTKEAESVVHSAVMRNDRGTMPSR